MKNLNLILLGVAGIFLIACSPDEKAKDFDKFTGRWALHLVERKSDSLSPWQPAEGSYKNRQGYILYDGKGGMGVHHVPEAYESYTLEGKGGLDSLTTKDLRHLAGNFVYFGKYRVNDSLQRIEHYIESSSLPYMWGTIAGRAYSFHGDTLTLSPITDRYPKMRLHWVRLEDMP
ncbi:lipocalin-like domain-containing protein [Robertkochia flava]|uniref:lipocalin-like domain-containing protein n=1 Tax=Robertkochia flava TaxID=3447986 RepID=UPI001CCF5C64|nr:lipocalin-like domain-containing protein [Robertkochia marina]